MRISDWCSDVCSSDLREPVFGPGNAPRGPSRGKPGQAFAGPWSRSRGTMRKFFGTDGIRGLTNPVPMTAEVAMRVGMAAGAHFPRGTHTERVMIGRDRQLAVTGQRVSIREDRSGRKSNKKKK